LLVHPGIELLSNDVEFALEMVFVFLDSKRDVASHVLAQLLHLAPLLQYHILHQLDIIIHVVLQIDSLTVQFLKKQFGKIVLLHVKID
jgi:hypothetical protein